MLLPLDISPGAIFIILLFALMGLIITLVALIDILKSDFGGNDKLVWVLVVIFLGFIGAILYFAIGQQQKLSKSQ